MKRKINKNYVGQIQLHSGVAFFAGDGIGGFRGHGDSGVVDSAVRAADGKSVANFFFFEKLVAAFDARGVDKKSVRAFERKIDERTLEFFAVTDSSEIVDAETGSVWDFSGVAVKGKLAGKQLEKIQVLKDYWFDWKNYNSETQLYTLGSR